MDQVALFQAPEEILFSSIRPQLERVLAANWADSSLLTMEKRQSYYSVMFDGSVIVRLKSGKRPYIELPDIGHNIPGGKKSENYIKVKLEEFGQAGEYMSYIEEVLQATIDAIPKEFSCCSRYMECSDKISCTNPDKDMAMRCGYRKVLMSGKVFYGGNRNID